MEKRGNLLVPSHFPLSNVYSIRPGYNLDRMLKRSSLTRLFWKPFPAALFVYECLSVPLVVRQEFQPSTSTYCGGNVALVPVEVSFLSSSLEIPPLPAAKK